MWPTGLHIAPYLSPDGRFVLVALGKPSWFIIAAEIKALEGWRNDDGEDGRGSEVSARILEPSANHDGMIPFISPYSAGLRGRSLSALLWSRGVHTAPWQCSVMQRGKLLKGRPLIAVDARHRMVAEMFCPEEIDPEPTRRDLLAILESFEESARDTIPTDATPEIGDGPCPDEDDDSGENWKRASREI